MAASDFKSCNDGSAPRQRGQGVTGRGILLHFRPATCFAFFTVREFSNGSRQLACTASLLLLNSTKGQFAATVKAVAKRAPSKRIAEGQPFHPRSAVFSSFILPSKRRGTLFSLDTDLSCMSYGERLVADNCVTAPFNPGKAPIALPDSSKMPECDVIKGLPVCSRANTCVALFLPPSGVRVRSA